MKTVTYEIGTTRYSPFKDVCLGLSRRNLEDEEVDGDKYRPRIALFVEIDGAIVSMVERKEGGSMLGTAWQAIKTASVSRDLVLDSDEKIAFAVGYAASESKK